MVKYFIFLPSFEHLTMFELYMEAVACNYARL